MDAFWLISACLAAGGLIGFSGGVVGIGGGLFAIPLLGLILGSIAERGFVQGQLIGGADDLQKLLDSGELERMLAA